MLRDSIVWEYVLAVGVSAFLWFVLPKIVYFLGELEDKKDHKGWEGLGVAIIMLFVYLGLNAVLAAIFLAVNPIRILTEFKQELAIIEPLGKRIGTYLLIGFPIPFSLLFIFRRWVEEFLYHLLYETGKNGYAVASANYKDPQEFKEELLKRHLYFTEDHRQFLDELNEKYDVSSLRHKEEYYTPARMQILQDKHDDWYGDNVINPGDGKKAPAYLYNSILVLQRENGELQYAPIGRYTMNGSSYGGEEKKPFHQDFYIECKILFIDGHLYAIIGVGESRCIQESFKEYHRPYYILLSEEEKITTYFDGKYYPDGAVGNGFSHVYPLRMLPNTRKDKKDNPHRPINYPVRKVDRVDRETINAVARELQKGILKESAEYFMSGKYTEHLNGKSDF